MAFLSKGAEQHLTVEQDYPIIDSVVAVKGVPVKNVIYMIGDGMGFPHVSTAWVANKGKLNMDRFPVTGMARTWCSNKLITDSAAAGTALATGSKTTYGTVGMSPEGKNLNSLLVHAQGQGKATGVIVTCDLTDATPAAFFSHVPKRAMAIDIAGFLPESRIDFFVAGGMSKLKKRPDGRDILDEMRQKGYEVSINRDQLKETRGNKVCAILADKNLPSPRERGNVLEKAVEKGMDVLSRNENGFFLMVEGSKIDKAAHKGDLAVMIDEIFDFDRAVGKALQWAESHPGTLVVVTADHNTGGLTLLGGDKKTGKVVCDFSTTSHNGVSVPVFAFGAGADSFTGIYENIEIPKKILAAMKNGSAKGLGEVVKGREACHQMENGGVGLEKKGIDR